MVFEATFQGDSMSRADDARLGSTTYLTGASDRPKTAAK
jgi:hypothetical protein